MVRGGVFEHETPQCLHLGGKRGGRRDREKKENVAKFHQLMKILGYMGIHYIVFNFIVDLEVLK